jgi:hypothetical protein
MLSKYVDGIRRVAATTHDRTPSHDGGSMIGFLWMNENWSETKIETGQGN